MTGLPARRILSLSAAALLAAAAGQAWARREENTNSKEEEEMFQSASQLYQGAGRDKAAAIEAYERFVKSFSDSPRAVDAEFLVGEANMQQALQILKAEATAKKASTARLLAPRNTAALASLQAAREAFSAVVERYGKKNSLGPSAQYRIGEVFYNQKDWGGAIEEFRKVEKNFPKAYIVPESWLGIIFADLALEQFSQAEANLFLLGETYPNYLKQPEVLYAQGVVSLHKGDYAGAEKALSRVQSDEAQFYLGKTYLLSKRPYLAAAAFERLVRDYPDSDLKEEAEFFIGDSFFLAKDFDGAITKYQRFIAKFPDSRLKVSALFRIGSSHFQKAAYVDARANFQSVLDRYPQDFFAPLAQYFIAESYLVGSQMREALFAYTKVITQYPETIKISPLAHYKLAWTELQVGDYAQAAQTCQNFLALYPANALAKNVYLILGNSLLNLKRYNEAVTAFQRIIDLAPTSEIAEQALYAILQSQYALKNYDSILTSYQFIFRHLPPSQSKWRSLSYLYAAEAYLNMNQTDEAKAIYQMILKVYPNDPAAFYAQDGLAWCYTRTGQDADALEARQKLVDMMSAANSSFTISGQNSLGIADSMFNQKKYDDAYQLYDKFVKENPKAPEAPSSLYRAGMSLYHLRYYTQAIEEWQKLQNDYPNAKETQQAVYQTADTLFRAQKYKEAVAAYKGIIEKYPDSKALSLAYLRVAQSAFNDKDDDSTVREAKAMLEKYPDSKEATDALDLMEAVFDRSASFDFQKPLRDVVAAKPHSQAAGDAQFRLARRLFDLKRYDQAAVEFQSFSVDFTENAQLPKAQFMLAEAYFASAKYTEAVPAFQRYLNNFPRSEDTPRALFHMGSAYYNQKDYANAVTNYQRLLEEYPESEHAQATQFNLALAYKALGKLDSAQEAYTKYANAVGTSDKAGLASLWEVFGIQKERKDYDAALATLGRIRETANLPADSQLEAAYRSGEIYTLLGRQPEAVDAWEKMRGMPPASSPFRLQAMIKLGEIYEKGGEIAKAVSAYEDLAKNAEGDVAVAAKERAAGLRKQIKGSARPASSGAPAPQVPGAEETAVDDLLKTQVMPEEGNPPASGAEPKPAAKKGKGKKKAAGAAPEEN